jgi:hypothetical protein
MFSPSVSLISINYLPVHSNNVSAMAEAAAAAPPLPPHTAAAGFFFLFSTKGPFQGHIFPICLILHQINLFIYFLLLRFLY